METACLRADLSPRADLIDYVSVTVGSTHTLAGTADIVPSMFSQTGVAERLAGEMRNATGLPVMVCGRLNQPHLAESALASGQADMVGFVRALLTDPQFPNKAREGRADDIRACIACNQACIGHRNQGHGVSCIQYPESGRELEFGTLIPAHQTKTIVVGGRRARRDESRRYCRRARPPRYFAGAWRAPWWAGAVGADAARASGVRGDYHEPVA